MPESPETKSHLHTPVTSPNTMAGGVTPAIRDSNRPLSNNTGWILFLIHVQFTLESKKPMSKFYIILS